MEELQEKSPPIFKAIKNCNVRRIKSFAERFPEMLSQVGKYGGTPFDMLSHRDVEQWADPDTYKEAVRFFLDKNAPLSDGNTILHLVSDRYSPEEFRALQKDFGLDINARNNLGETPLLAQLSNGKYASPEFWEGNQHILSHLLESHDVDIKASDNEGRRAIHHAAMGFVTESMQDVMDRLLQKGFDINELDNHEKTPFGLSSEDPALSYFLHHGGMVNPKNPAENTKMTKKFALPVLDYDVPKEQFFDVLVWELKNLDAKISRRIPDEKNIQEFMAFADVIQKINYAARVMDSSTTKFSTRGKEAKPNIPLFYADMIERTTGSWQQIRDSLKEFSLDDCWNVRDAVRAFTESVVLPEVVQRTRHRAKKIDYSKVVDLLVPEVAKVIIGNRSFFTLLHFSREWHHRLPALESARTVARTGQWEKATPDFTASNGYLATFLNKAEDLAAEGKALKHCVGGYVEDCKQRGKHIISIRKPIKSADGETFVPVSTAEFDETPDSDAQLKLVQHRGYRDIPPMAHYAEAIALKEFMTRVHKQYSGKDKMVIDFARLRDARDKIKDEVVNTAYTIGYDPFAKDAPEKQDEFFKLYMDINAPVGPNSSFIPGGKTKWGNKTAEDFLGETGLMDKVLWLSNPKSESWRFISPLYITHKGGLLWR
jgi:PcfJ-like protein